jgi:inosose dehydratase
VHLFPASRAAARPGRGLSRRRLLAATATATAVATGSSLCASRFAAAAVSHDLTLGLQLFSLRKFPVTDALGHAKELGFDAVEFYPGMLPVNATPETIADIRRQVADLGLKISAHGVNRFTGDAAANRRIFEFAKTVGIGILTADPDPNSFESLDELVREFDIRVAIHNHGPRHRYNKATDVLHAIEGHDVRIGACADLGHYIRSGERPVDVIRLLAGRLYGIHLKDFAEMQDKSHGVILGRGHVDVPAVFAALEQAGFPADGALSLEYEANPDDPFDDIRQCVEVARAALAAT